MRELIFRAWDGKQMIDEVWSWRYYRFDNDFHDKWMYGINASNIHLMQYTGLLDKSGTRIFEGDVFQYTAHSGYTLPTFKGNVAWDDDLACYGYWRPFEFDPYKVFTPFSNHDEIVHDVLGHLQVIGHIYQPEWAHLREE